MSKTIAYDSWDAEQGRFRHYVAEFNPTTGVYDSNVTETDEIGLPLGEGR